MVQYSYTKIVNLTRLALEIGSAGLSVHHIDTSGSSVLIYFENGLSQGQKSTLDSVVSAHAPVNTEEVVSNLINEAMLFGQSLIKEFTTKNVMLGITQRGLTGHVRRTLREVKDALETGSMYDAVTEVKNLNTEDFDDAIITPARLLAFRNRIEEWLEVPLAEAWDDPETWL